MDKKFQREIKIALILGYSVLALTLLWKKQENIYPETMIVQQVQHLQDFDYEITVKNSNNQIFKFVSDGDYVEGDILSVLMDGRNTKSVLDDKILKVKYCAF